MIRCDERKKNEKEEKSEHMSSVAKLHGTIDFSYYNRRSQKETIRLRQDDAGGLARVKEDGSQESLYRFDGISSAPIPCDNYNDLKTKMAGSPNLITGWNTVFHESYDLMQDYYSGKISCEDVKSYIRGICRCNTETDIGRDQAVNTLSLAYEYMSRANSRSAVSQNMNEAEEFVIGTGLHKDCGDHFSNKKGVVYYNADYYYAYKNMQDVFKQTIDELAEGYGVEKPDYDALDGSNRFPDGGATYNSVWNHRTYQENVLHHLNEFRYFDDGFVPEEGLVFCEAELLFDDTSDMEKLRANIKEYISEKLGRGDGTRNSLLMELERHNRDDKSGVVEAKKRIRRYFDDSGISFQNIRDQRWTRDYFGMIIR